MDSDHTPSQPLKIQTGFVQGPNLVREQGVFGNVMEETECPFVNSADGRCAEHLTVTDVGYAFDHCFDHYERCPVYLERCAEQRERVAAEQAAQVGADAGDQIRVEETRATRWSRLRTRFTQLTLRRKPLRSRQSSAA